MADVIRRAIIEIETRQKKSRLEAPGADSATGFKAQAEAAGKAEAAIQKAETAQRNLAETSRASAYTMVKGFREAGEGAFRAARGITLLANSGSDDLRRLVQSVALAQGVFDVFAGSFKAVTNLIPLLGGPLTAGIAAATVAIGAGVIAWTKWREAAREALEKAAEQTTRVENKIIEFNDVVAGRNRRRVEASEFRIDSALTDKTREQRLREELVAERQAGSKFARAAETDTSTGGRTKFEFVESSARQAEESIRRQVSIEKQLHAIAQAREEEKQRALNSVLQSQARFFGIRGNFFELPATSPVFDQRTQAAEQQIERLGRAAQKFADIAEEMDRRVNGLQYSK